MPFIFMGVGCETWLSRVSNILWININLKTFVLTAGSS